MMFYTRSASVHCDGCVRGRRCRTKEDRLRSIPRDRTENESFIVDDRWANRFDLVLQLNINSSESFCEQSHWKEEKEIDWRAWPTLFFPRHFTVLPSVFTLTCSFCFSPFNNNTTTISSSSSSSSTTMISLYRSWCVFRYWICIRPVCPCGSHQ